MPKLAERLTDIKIKNTKAKLKPFKLSAVRGLHLLVKTDSSKHWQFRFRFDGKENTIAIGRYPEVSLANSEKQATSSLELLADGINPSENKKAAKASKTGALANSFEVVAREWAISYFTNKSDSHKDCTVRRLESYLFPWLGNKPVSEITAPQILEVIKRIENLNKLEAAHRTLQATSQVFRYAVQTGRALRDPCVDLRGALPATVVKHMAAFTEPKEIAELLRAIDGFTGSLTVQIALIPFSFYTP